MNYQTTYPSSPDYVIDAEFTEVPEEQKSMLQRMFQYWLAPIGSSPERTMEHIQNDRCHAFVAATALRHTAMLSAMEQKATELAPQGASRYREIVNAYAQKAADKVRRW